MNKPQGFIGIDPGSMGQICLFAPESKFIHFIPTAEHPVKILAGIEAFKDSFNVRVILLEKVHSVFGTSAKSNFNFGYNVGIVNTLALLSQVTVDFVQPKKWQKTIGVTKKGKEIKKEVASICSRLYPDAEIYGPKGGLLDGKSDALMIAHYAFLNYKV